MSGSAQLEEPLAPTAPGVGGRYAPPQATHDAATPSEQNPLDVPRDTTPTWEIELLVSGAVLFGLLQLPGFIHSVTARWEPNVGVPGLFGIVVANLLIVSAVYALATCFILHLVLRGFWVALVGVHSVFPGGTRWDQLKQYGPVQSEITRSQFRPLPEHIARVDNVASLVFATGFVMAASTLTGVAYFGILALPAWAAERIWGVNGVLWTLGVVLVPILVVLAAAQILDARMARGTFEPAGRRARYVRRVMGTLSRLSPRGVKSLGAVLMTNVPKRVVIGILMVGFAGAMGGAWVSAENDAELPGASNFRYFADASPRSIVATEYGSLRGDAEPSTRRPSLDSDVATGPYLRLFVPYRTLRHNEALKSACPGLRPLAGSDEDAPELAAMADSVLTCAERVHRVTLDGAPVPGLRFRFFADVKDNRRGFLAYVPTAGLAAGEHTIAVWPSRLPGDEPPKRPYELRFWK